MSEFKSENIEPGEDDGQYRDTAFFGIVGGDAQIAEELIDDMRYEFYDQSEKAFRDNKGEIHAVKELEREKTPEESQLLQDIIDKLENFVKNNGGTPLLLEQKHFHFLDIDKLKARGLPPQSFYEPSQQFVAICRRDENLLRLAQEIVHEALHFESYYTLQMAGDDPATFRRVGFGVQVRGQGEDTFFDDINEAVLVELQIRFEKECMSYISCLEGDLERKQRNIANFLLLEPDRKQEADGFAYIDDNFMGAPYPYDKGRKLLKEIIEKICEKTEMGFEIMGEEEKDFVREEIFIKFVKATITGNLLPIARLVEKTYGKGSFKETKKAQGVGSFRKLGETTKNPKG